MKLILGIFKRSTQKVKQRERNLIASINVKFFGLPEQAGVAAQVEYRRLLGNDALHVAWFQDLCANALVEIQAAAATRAFQQTQERASPSWRS